MFVVAVGDIEISLKTGDADESSQITCRDQELANWLYAAFGRDQMIGNVCSPRDLIAALINMKLPYEIKKGADLLAAAIDPLPAGAIP
jgi:hypothetical protein